MIRFILETVLFGILLFAAAKYNGLLAVAIVIAYLLHAERLRKKLPPDQFEIDLLKEVHVVKTPPSKIQEIDSANNDTLFP
jgi:hypothetical protein